MGPRVVVVLALGLAACSINHVSEELACTVQADCTAGRSCVNNFCVVASGSGCPDQCVTCDTTARSCTLDGSGNGNNTLSCPDGYDCTVNCTGRCRRIDCSDARSCTITCSGAGACEEIDCGDGRCTISCTGADSCNNVDCGNSCACDLTCTGADSCNQSDCPNNCEAGAGCTSSGNNCNEC